MLVLGACVGSFLNVVILRLPVMMHHQWRQQCAELLDPTADQPVTPEDLLNLGHPASHCPTCKQPLKPWHNIPVISYIALGAKCAWCKAGISWRYPAIEIITSLATAHLAMEMGIGWPLLASLFLLWALICLAVIDFDHQLLPDSITIPLLWGGLLANYFALITTLESSLIGAVAGYLGFWLVYQIHFRITGREGLGYGDFKLLAALGAWLGWEMLPIIVLMASVAGTLVAVLLLISKNLDSRAPVSFGPFLTFAGWVALLWGQEITANYLGLFNF